MQQGCVFYFVGEGFKGVRRRLGAWEQYHGQRVDIELSSTEIYLDDSENLLPLVQQELRDHRKNPTLIIIDPLANHNSGEENSAREMLVTKSGAEYMKVTCGKARDWEPFDPIEFQLCNQDVLVDGEPVPSCVLEERAYVQSSKIRELSAKERMAKERFLELSEQSEDGTVKRSSWYKDLKDKDIAPHDPQKKRMFNKMVEFGVFESHGEGRDVYLIPGIQKDYDYP